AVSGPRRANSAAEGAVFVEQDGRRRRRQLGVGQRAERVLFKNEPDRQAAFHRPVPVGDQAQLAHVPFRENEADDEFAFLFGRQRRELLRVIRRQATCNERLVLRRPAAGQGCFTLLHVADEEQVGGRN